MRILLFVPLFLSSFLLSQAQKARSGPKKYPSLLWEISGKGLKKPSYLFGTMHVSSKMVFHLSDSFYVAIRNADVVALETNPDNWQEDMSRYNWADEYGASPWGGRVQEPADFLQASTLRFTPYEKLIEVALSSSPSMINSFLYRNNSEGSSDFEEDTYLDLYIFQVGRKWGKKVCGVENFEESMRLMKEAYEDAAKEKNRKERNFDLDEEFASSRLEDAYRTGNLDLLDTIHVLNSFSSAFDEKFLYRRNDIQAASIDSILKTGATLFAGVGAAHLPGHRGVIEILRRKGYRLRPIKMSERDSRHKDEIEKIKVPVTFSRRVSEDGLFGVEVPGPFYQFGKSFGRFGQQQYADMSNGSYYVVTRIQTNAALWGHSAEAVTRKVDSVLYENVPGKILWRKPITRNGYRGFDIGNRTRRGDVQRYHIFITPVEVLVFKMSGTGEYVKDGLEAARFFNSIQLSERRGEWKKFRPATGGFEVDLPHQPYTLRGENWLFAATDRQNGSTYEVIRTDIHNYGFAEEDSFDLNLMEESFAGSDFIDKELSRKQLVHAGYPALDMTYRGKDGSTIQARFLIQGPHYYTLVARAPRPDTRAASFFSSFSIRPFVYPAAVLQTDTALYFTVQSPLPLYRKEKADYPSGRSFYNDSDEDENEEEAAQSYRSNLVAHDTTGEKVHVTFFRLPRYFYQNDSSWMTQLQQLDGQRNSWIVRRKREWELPDRTKVWEYQLSDTNSSRMIRTKILMKDGAGYMVRALGDTLTAGSAFVGPFFDTFHPTDTVKTNPPTMRKTPLFFEDFFSSDSTRHKRAVRNVEKVEFEENDLDGLIRVVRSLGWKEKKYLEVKKELLGKLAAISTPKASDFLKEQYYAAGDTLDLQYASLESLLAQGTAYSFQTFKNILLHEPPVLDVSGEGISKTYIEVYGTTGNGRLTTNGSFFSGLYDSLELTATIFRDLMPLLQISDYKMPVMQLMGELVDSNLLRPKDYASYVPQFLIEAKQAVKKQVILEKSKAIEKAQATGEKNGYTYRDREEGDNGNDVLSLYAVLLAPFRESNPGVAPLLNQMLNSSDKRLKYNTALLLLRQKAPVPDSIWTFFAASDDFRYELKYDLDRLNAAGKFPAAYAGEEAMARGKLFFLHPFDRPDTLVLLQKQPFASQKKQATLYFFKYREKKEDSWKIAVSELSPDESRVVSSRRANRYDRSFSDLTDLTETKLDREDPLAEQLQKLLKRMVYSKRKSAARFYEAEGRNWMSDYSFNE